MTFASGRGRGAYYKALYGGRGGGRGRAARENSSCDVEAIPASKRPKLDKGHVQGSGIDLIHQLIQKDGSPYPAYRDLIGIWEFVNPSFTTSFIFAQSDPYAPPSKFTFIFPNHYPAHLHNSRIRRIALQDYLLRVFSKTCSLRNWDKSHQASQSGGGGWGGKKGGEIGVDRPGQQVLERSALVMDDKTIEVRCTVNLPASGRNILGREAAAIFRDRVPELIHGLSWETQDQTALKSFVDSVEDQEFLRSKIVAEGLICFVSNGSILPRIAGNSDLPLKSPGIVKFQSPPSLEKTFILPNQGNISGMAIPKGITMIAGGGFHGKSTLLSAISTGIYNHIPGDGRELVVTDPKTIHVKVEDGRSVKNVDISPFIRGLPGGASTVSFCTRDASGSTSMSAAVIEGIEMGARCLCLDEDTAATNFLIRDRRMQKLISSKSEPIIALIFRVRALFKDHGVSCILVIGGCGDYMDVSQLVIEMRNYEALDQTERARQIAQEEPSTNLLEEHSTFGPISQRTPNMDKIHLSEKSSVKGTKLIQIGEEGLELGGLEQLVSVSQTRILLEAFSWFGEKNRQMGMKEIAHLYEETIEREGVDAIKSPGSFTHGMTAYARSLEFCMALNRMRSIEFIVES